MDAPACALLLVIPPANAGPNAPSADLGEPMTDTLGVLAATWGVLMAISPLLQLRRMLHRRSSADVSITYLSVLQVGFTLWILYGWALGNPAIMIPNAVALVVGAATIVVAVRYRHPEEAAPRP
jgi:MtN3 and saliva related transmembrane protein